MNEEEAEKLTNPKTADEIKAVINELPTHRSPGPDSFTGEFYKALKEELTPTLQRIFQKIQENGRLPNSFYDTNIIINPKEDKDITKNGNFRSISLMNRLKYPQQNIDKPHPAIH